MTNAGKLTYPMRIYRDPDATDSVFLAWIPDINSDGIGIYTQGKTVEDARAMARDALTGCILAKLDDGMELDKPSELRPEEGWEWVYPHFMGTSIVTSGGYSAVTSAWCYWYARETNTSSTSSHLEPPSITYEHIPTSEPFNGLNV